MSPTDQLQADPCFPADQIRALLLGRGSGETAARLARHMPGCPHCTAVADVIGLDSVFVCGLRRDDLPPPPSDDELADVVARVSRIDRSSWGGRTKSSRPAIDLPGRLGPYRLVELLGVGGMGVVYRAEDTALHRFVAVKVVKGSVDAGMRSRFLSEARALAAVRHDNVVTVYYVGEEPTAAGAIPYLAMELLEGQTLRDWMTAAPRPSVEWIVQAGRQIAAGLAFAHDVGLVHRDVKPANLWLEAPQGWTAQPKETRPSLEAVSRVKLLDFGLAHPPGVTAEASVAGTPAYMAPEQARGEAVDARTDLFGLGCVLYELCTGKLPFPERDRRWIGGRESPPMPVRSLNPAVPERLAILIERLLAADRADRPVSARVVEFELAALDIRSSVMPTMSGQADATITIRPNERPKRRRLWVTGVVAAALLVAAGVVAVIASTNSADTTHNTSDNEFPPQPAIIAEKAEPSTTDQRKTPVATEVVIDEEWYRMVSTLPPQQQLNAVFRALGQLNPKFNWLEGSGWVEPDSVRRITVDADTVSDLRPVRALKEMRVVRYRGSAPGLGIVTDLSPLSELKLKELHCRNNPGLHDLSPIQLETLQFLDASYTGLENLRGLTKAPLTTLKIDGTPINDLRPIRKMSRLQALYCAGCPITDFEPLTAIQLRELFVADIRAEDAAVLKRIKTLQKINGKPVKEFWKSFSPVCRPNECDD